MTKFEVNRVVVIGGYVNKGMHMFVDISREQLPNLINAKLHFSYSDGDSTHGPSQFYIPLPSFGSAVINTDIRFEDIVKTWNSVVGTHPEEKNNTGVFLRALAENAFVHAFNKAAITLGKDQGGRLILESFEVSFRRSSFVGYGVIGDSTLELGKLFRLRM